MSTLWLPSLTEQICVQTWRAQYSVCSTCICKVQRGREGARVTICMSAKSFLHSCNLLRCDPALPPSDILNIIFLLQRFSPFNSRCPCGVIRHDLHSLCLRKSQAYGVVIPTSAYDSQLHPMMSHRMSRRSLFACWVNVTNLFSFAKGCNSALVAVVCIIFTSLLTKKKSMLSLSCFHSVVAINSVLLLQSYHAVIGVTWVLLIPCLEVVAIASVLSFCCNSLRC